MNRVGKLVEGKSHNASKRLCFIYRALHPWLMIFHLHFRLILFIEISVQFIIFFIPNSTSRE